jgi:hypothetical protein
VEDGIQITGCLMDRINTGILIISILPKPKTLAEVKVSNRAEEIPPHAHTQIRDNNFYVLPKDCMFYFNTNL